MACVGKRDGHIQRPRVRKERKLDTVHAGYAFTCDHISSAIARIDYSLQCVNLNIKIDNRNYKKIIEYKFKQEYNTLHESVSFTYSLKNKPLISMTNAMKNINF